MEFEEINNIIIIIIFFIYGKKKFQNSHKTY